MRILRNKFFIICVAVALVLTLIPSVLALMGYRSLSRNIVGVVTTPFRWCGNILGGAIDGFGKYFGGIKTLDAENAALREENALLRLEAKEAEILRAENDRLKEYLEMKAQHADFSFEEGTVISRDGSNYVSTYTLDRGTVHGITTGMPVVTKLGIVGYVSEVGTNWCRVSTLLETASAVGALIPRSGASGIVGGSFTLAGQGLCELAYLDIGADVKVGDLVYSGGTGSVYPGGLLIGEVTAVRTDEYTRTLVATVRPVVDYEGLAHALIITGYEPAAPTP